MGKIGYQLFYSRHLPHYQPPGVTLFITFRLAGSLPQGVIRQLLAERIALEGKLKNSTDSSSNEPELDRIQRYIFGKMDSYLVRVKAGPFWLKDQRIASAVVDSIRYGVATVYDLEAYCIMPNHVHLVCTPRQNQDGEYHSVSSIMHSIKRQSANRANRLLDRQGAFWQHESYDRVIRDENEMGRVIQYVAMNPVSAGLVQNWQDWRWTYLADRWKELGFR